VVTFYPASGYRVPTSGAFINTGAAGHYWSFALSGTNACHLGFWSSAVYPTYSNGRAYGFPVRCVQHLQLLKYSVL
jgi:hypothetical protein